MRFDEPPRQPRMEAILALYEQRFGPANTSWPEFFFEGERPVLDEEGDESERARILALFDAAPRFEYLFFWDGSTPGAHAVYASLGAVDLPARHEIFVVQPIPYGTGLVTSIIGSRTTPLCPLEIVSCAPEGTPFEAVLLAPVADGLVLGPVGGTVRHALRAIPLTRAERGFAEDHPEKALALLREAGAFVADPLRECLFEPERTRDRRRRVEAALYADTGEGYRVAVESRARIRALAARQERETREELARHPGDRRARARIQKRYRELRVPAEMLANAERLVAQRRAILSYLDARGGPPPAERHVPYPLHRAVPPDARRVAQRAQVHAAIGERLRVEDGSTGGGERARLQLLALVDSAGLRAEMEPYEAVLIDAPFGSLSRGDLARVSLHGQAALVFAWALHLVEQPPHDEKGTLGHLFPASAHLAPLLDSPELRSLDERIAYLNLAHALHWRIRMLDESPGPMDVLEAAKDEGLWFGSLSFDGVPLVSGDIAVDGRPIHQASPERVKLLSHVALGRLRAASWLAGLHPLYSESPVSLY